MVLTSLSRWMAATCVAGIVSLLAACGGGSSDAPLAPPETPSGVVRYEVSYQRFGTLPGSAVQARRYLTVRPLSGDTTMGTRPAGSVQLVFDQEEPRTLTTPTYVDLQGRPNYAFEISDSYPAIFSNAGLCSRDRPLRVTVTDTAGLSFTKHAIVCVGEDQSVAAASDYGDRVATFTASGPPGLTSGRFSRTAPSPFVDATISRADDGNNSWTLRVAEGDQLVSSVSLLPENGVGATATARVAVEGGAYAQSAAMRTDQPYNSSATALLLCCRHAPDASAPLQTVSFVLTADLWLSPRPAGFSVPVDVQYRIVDGTTGQTRVESSESLTLGGSAAVWTFQARQGDRMFMQSSSPLPYSFLSTRIVSGDGGPQLGRYFGLAETAAAGAPATLDVFVPAAP